MALVVTHNSTADGDPLIDGDDWNANHTLTGGGTFRLPVLIESKTLAAGTVTTTFSDLDGDSDVEYFMWFNLVSADGLKQKMYFSGDTTDSHYDGMEQGFWTGGTWNTGEIKPFFVDYNSTAGMGCYGTCLINAKTGNYRPVITKSITFGSQSDLPHPINNIFQWEDSSTNITSITINHDDADHGFSGSSKLYKMVDLTI